MKTYREFVETLNETPLQEALFLTLLDIKEVDVVRSVKGTKNGDLTATFKCSGKIMIISGVSYDKAKNIFEYTGIDGADDGYTNTVIKTLKKNGFVYKTIDEAVQVDTSRFEFTHGKKPKGRGGWAFATSPNVNVRNGKLGVDYVFVSGLYTAAKKEAAKQLGTNRLWALP